MHAADPERRNAGGLRAQRGQPRAPGPAPERASERAIEPLPDLRPDEQLSSLRTRSPSRRELLALGIGAFVVAGLPLAARRGRRLLRRTLPVMGTLAELAVVHDDPQRARAALEAALDELRFVERRMSRFSPDSDVGRANAGAALAPVQLSPETGQVLSCALHMARATAGAFDPCLGRLTQLWDVTRRREPPAAEQLSRFADRHLFRSLELGGGASAPSVRFSDADVAIDLGGIAKGYGVDRAVAALRAHGIRDGLVNVGGDLYVLGRSRDGDLWRVGVRSPGDPTQLSHTLHLGDAAVATSGDYARGFSHAGRRYHHLLDVHAAAPRRAEEHSLTVVAERCMTADAAATAAFGLPAHEARALLASCAPGAMLATPDASRVNPGAPARRSHLSDVTHPHSSESI
ncbi:MAG: hypothetical protein DRQ55_16495 [Planctomycetota bacterium]|nr:MAG: hypothetical protein DRQ55_16495 [Planctomycetota bacterium]